MTNYPTTTDPNEVTRVWWSIASERVSDYYETWNGRYHEGHYDESPEGQRRAELRMKHAIDSLLSHIAQTYPNCNDYMISNGGFENQYSSYAPRVETEEGYPYEYGLDDMIQAEGGAIASAFKKYPPVETQEEEG